MIRLAMRLALIGLLAFCGRLLYGMRDPKGNDADHGTGEGQTHSSTPDLTAVALRDRRDKVRSANSGTERPLAIWTKRLAIATFLVALATFLVGIVAGWQVYDTHQAFVTSQRAFVYIDKIEWHSVEKEEAVNFPPPLPLYGKNVKRVVELTVTMRNSGNTPANRLRFLIDCPIDAGKVGDPFDLFKWREDKAVPQPLGPHQDAETSPCAELTDGNVGGNALGLVPIYVIGEIRYFDSVEPQKERTTQFAKELRFFNEDLSHLNGRAVSVGKHNCTDDDCRFFQR